MTIRELFYRVDRWSPRSYNDDEKIDIFGDVINEICDLHDFDFLKRSDDRLSTDSGTRLTGTVTMTAASTAVTGSGTAFTTELSVGEGLYLDDGGVDYVAYVASITSDTALTLVAAYEGTGGSGDATTYRTKYALSEIVSNAGATIDVKRVIELWDASENKVVYEVVGGEIVFEDDPGTQEFRVRTVRRPTQPAAADLDASGTYTMPLPGNQSLEYAGMMVKIEEDVYDDAKPSTVRRYERALRSFMADYTGSRSKKVTELEMKTYVETEDGTQIEAF